MNNRVVKSKGFVAALLVPLDPVPDGTSLEEQINEFFGESGERSFVDAQYGFDGGSHTALLFYTE